MCTIETGSNIYTCLVERKDGQKKKELAVRCPIRAGFVRYSISFDTLSTLRHTLPPLILADVSVQSDGRREGWIRTRSIHHLFTRVWRGPARVGEKAPQGFSRQNNATKRAMVVWLAGVGWGFEAGEWRGYRVVGAGSEAAVTFVNMAAVSCACLPVCAQVRLGASKQASKLAHACIAIVILLIN